MATSDNALSWEEYSPSYYSSDLVSIGEVGDDDHEEYYYIVHRLRIDTIRTSRVWRVEKTPDASGWVTELIARYHTRERAQRAAEMHAEMLATRHEIAADARYRASRECADESR